MKAHFFALASVVLLLNGGATEAVSAEAIQGAACDAVATVAATLPDTTDANDVGLTYWGGRLWRAGHDGFLYEVDPSTGTVLSTLDTGFRHGLMGLTHDESSFWVVNHDDGRIYEIGHDGAVLSSFATPNMDGGTERRVEGITWDGSSLWYADSALDRIFQLDRSGAVLSSFPSPGYSPQGLAWAGCSLWHFDDRLDLIYQLDPLTGAVMTSFETPAPGEGDLTVANGSLWFSTNGTRLLYRYDLPRHCLSGCAEMACVEDVFEDGALGTDWTLTGIGNANQVSATELEGFLALTADGATAFYGADNAGFLYRQASGDFRLETAIDSTPMTTGGQYRKAGLMARVSEHPWDARLLALILPFWQNQDETHLQFVARESFGTPGRLPVARDVVGIPRVLNLAIERTGDVLAVEYSLDGGSTWIRPTTGLGGSIQIDELPETLLVGPVMVSNDISVTSTALFEEIAICQEE